MLENLDRRGGADRILFSNYAPDTNIEGKTLQQVADARGAHPADLAMELVNGEDAPGIISFNMEEDDVLTLMRQPWTMTASDGDLVPPGEGVPHPRGYGTFPRKIRRYVVEEGAVDLAAAIRSMTSLPATVFRMRGRGEIRAGAVADLVVFDLARVRDRATFEDPHQLSEGMAYVLVNGVLAVEDGRFTAEKAGRVLDRRAGPQVARSERHP